MTALWKCQKCGLTFKRLTDGEPRTCPQCYDKGVKTYVGESPEKGEWEFTVEDLNKFKSTLERYPLKVEGGLFPSGFLDEVSGWDTSYPKQAGQDAEARQTLAQRNLELLQDRELQEAATQEYLENLHLQAAIMESALVEIANWNFDIQGDCVAAARGTARAALNEANRLEKLGTSSYREGGDDD